MNINTIKRFWGKVEKTDYCWVWTASKRNKGYGAFVYPSKNGDITQGRAHRFSWELHFGEIPNSLCVLHKCDNPSCVNPSHLFLGTKRDNNLDMLLKGRHRPGTSKTKKENCKYKKGRDHWNYKVTSETRSKIIKDRLNNLSYGKLSKKYNISIGHVWRIVNFTARKEARE